ncbi:hypothetical protein KKA33_01315 [Patescibacteria group bacterium]|nr:hypothetical protein [Patescibacteria group bacterium]
MNFRRIKHMLLRLSPEEKVAGIGAIIVLVSTFLPWFSIQFSSMKEGTTVSGFAGDLGVIGFVVFLLTGIGATFLIAEHLNLKLPCFGFKKNQIVLFLMGESAFLLLLTVAVYTKRSLEYTSAEMRFGLYAALIGAVAGTFAAFAEAQKHQKKETEAFFSHEEETVKYEETVDDAIEESEYQEQDYLPRKEKVIIEPSEAEQKSFFYDESPEIAAENEDEINDVPDEEPVSDDTEGADTNPRPEEEGAEETTEEPVSDDTAEPSDDAVETEDLPSPEEMPAESPDETPEDLSSEAEGTDLDPQPEDEGRAEEENLPPLSTGMDQGDYLVREAGVQKKSNIKVDMDSIKRVEKEDEPETQTMSFYDDL